MIKADEDFLEINHGEMSLKIPNNLADVTLAKNLLATFEELLKENPNIPLTIAEEEEEVEVPLETEAIIEADEQKVEMEIPDPPEEKEEGIPDRCPDCNAKVKTSKVKNRNNMMFQTVKCKKNWLFGNCSFKKEYAFKI